MEHREHVAIPGHTAIPGPVGDARWRLKFHGCLLACPALMHSQTGLHKVVLCMNAGQRYMIR
eukprot:1141245-Pelagomonas_calceolata.AAC.5